ncbi:RINT1-like protein MAG2 [Pyrus x bretschneideri]|uniref:RINT1-like protein MAG2 n=1 Tax=Pyrus x bretschneideri TaxID=225117 RepID=UPI00202DBD82|nr:RINT1-like protein MAG2 [Pyrus x bretschneideri]
MDSAVQTLPPASDLPPSILSFLDDKFRTNENLSGAPTLLSELQSQCDDLDRTLIDLNRRLGSSLLTYGSFSDRVHGLLGGINARLAGLGSSTRSRTSDGKGNERAEQILGEELPALAKEVARVQSVRSYAETALKLQTMIGDIEDAVSSTMKKNSWKHSARQNSEEMRLGAIKTLKLIEDVLTSVTKTHPQWAHLVSTVDHRVDRALAVLRPHAIADHRALLTSLGWPPPLATLTSSTPDTGRSTEVLNPLFTMQGDLKDQYCENFLALCGLQEFQRRRKSRQLEGYNRELALHQPLWVIEELVNPISLASQRHFTKWVDKPEFIFALVYKTTRDYVDSMDELLQPLVDEAMLTGYSCREEWISGMVSSLSTYLAKEIFPKYAGQPDEDSVTGTQSQARISWLHLIDLMISFDKRIKSLIENSGILLSLQDDGNFLKVSSLSVFSDRPDWLDLWAEMELNDILEKLKSDAGDERNWTMKVQGAAVLSDTEDLKAPAICSAYLRCLSSVVDRCRSLPSISMRSRFLRLAGVPIIQNFLESLLIRCQEAEGLTALTDDDGLVKVANSINAARYIESVLKEWCEDIFFLEIWSGRSDQLGISAGDQSGNVESVEGLDSGIFHEEVVKLEAFRIEWAEKLSVVILRGFEAQSRDYMKNRRQWQEKSEDGWTVSRFLVGALDYLQGKISVVETDLNGIDFVGVWRSLAARIDRLFFSVILMSNVKFSDTGVERLGSDLEVVFGAFRAWCLRPEGFFPKVSEGLKLLKMEAEKLRSSLARGEKWMKENGIRNLSETEVEKIVKSRVFKS